MSLLKYAYSGAPARTRAASQPAHVSSVSGLSGSFVGLNYQTNNFLGLGETLTVEANVGSRERNVLFGFTEPYMFDRPLQTGFTVSVRRANTSSQYQLASRNSIACRRLRGSAFRNRSSRSTFTGHFGGN